MKIMFRGTEMSIREAKKVAVDMDRNMVECLEVGLVEDAHAIHTDMVILEDLIINAEEVVSQMKIVAKEEAHKANLARFSQVKQDVDSAIKEAVKVPYREGARAVLGKQVESILARYKKVTGVDMNDEQIKFMKTINSVQANRVLKAIQG